MKTALKFFLPLVAVLVGVGVLVLLVKTKPTPARAATEARAMLVDVAPVKKADGKARVRAQGTVIAARQVVVVPQVQGQIQSLHPQLIPGGRVAAGETLVQINPQDYQLQVNQQQANVQRATFELQLEQGRGRIAEREWSLLGDTVPAEGDGRALALREPQRRTAEASLSAARSGLALSRLALSRTTIKAPFNALVLTEQVDEGQVVGPQTQVATLVDTDEFWVRVSVPIDELAWILLPERDGAASPVTITQQVGGSALRLQGEALRLQAEVDPVGRMARLLIKVPDPLGLGSEQRRLPLLLGSFVNVEIEGRPVVGAVTVPRAALHGGDTVYVRSAEKTLSVRKVEVLLAQRDEVMISQGIKEGEQIIVSRVDTPVEGLPVRDQISAPTPAPVPAPVEGDKKQ